MQGCCRCDASAGSVPRRLLARTHGYSKRSRREASSQVPHRIPCRSCRAGGMRHQRGSPSSRSLMGCRPGAITGFEAAVPAWQTDLVCTRLTDHREIARRRR
jgi:hypothetical protein